MCSFRFEEATGVEEDDDEDNERGDNERGEGELQGSDAYGGGSMPPRAARAEVGQRPEGGAALHAGPGGGAGRVSVPAAVGMEGATRGAAMVIMINMITIASIR